MIIDKFLVEEIKQDMINKILYQLEFNFKYNNSKLIIGKYGLSKIEDLENLNIDPKYYEDYFITGGEIPKKAIFLSLPPSEFVKYDFKCNQFVTLKEFYIKSFEIIKVLQEITL